MAGSRAMNLAVLLWAPQALPVDGDATATLPLRGLGGVCLLRMAAVCAWRIINAGSNLLVFPSISTIE